MDSTLNSKAIIIVKPKKTTRGRRKIPIIKIDNKSRKHVTFTKRRQGLFKKVAELSVLCGASVAVVAFSEAGKAFTFGHPSVDGVINRYLHGSSSSSVVVRDQRMWWKRPIEELGLEELEQFRSALAELGCNLEKRMMEIDLECQSNCVLVATMSSDFDDELLFQHGMGPIDNPYRTNGVSPVVSYFSQEFLPQML